jgi:hypothetical protein
LSCKWPVKNSSVAENSRCRNKKDVLNHTLSLKSKTSGRAGALWSRHNFSLVNFFSSYLGEREDERKDYSVVSVCNILKVADEI